MAEQRNRVSVTINERRYTLVANEDKDYIEGLAEHVNEKINEVRKESQNIAGERPLVLAALNICDEFFKLYRASMDMSEQNERLSSELSSARRELDSANAEIKRRDETAAQDKAQDDNLQKQLVDYSKELKKAKNLIKDLENQLKNAERKHNQEIEKVKEEYKKRENEFLEMIDRN